MRTDTVIRTEGTEILMKNLGLVDAERFIFLIQKEPFDYTEWQKDLFADLSAEELNRRAVEFCKNEKSNATPTKRRAASMMRKKKEFA